MASGRHFVRLSCGQLSCWHAGMGYVLGACAMLLCYAGILLIGVLAWYIEKVHVFQHRIALQRQHLLVNF